MNKLEKIALTISGLSISNLNSYATPTFLAMGLSDLTNKLGTALGVMMIFGFIWAIIKFISGANAITKGDPEGAKSSILGAILIAGASSIAGVIFKIFGMGGAVITPSF